MLFIKRHKIKLGIALVALVVITLTLSAQGNGTREIVKVTRGELVRTVELAGKVIPTEDVDLSFEVAGTISKTYKKVGDKVTSGEIIAELDQSGTYADLLKAQADLVAARAELSRLSGGNAFQAKVDNSKTSVVQKIRDAYTDADDAVSNKIDQFFDDARTSNPKIFASFDDYALRTKINEARVRIGSMLLIWRSRISLISPDTYVETDLENAKTHLREISAFLDDIARAVNSFKVSSSITQTMIDKYKTDVAAARQNINSASASLISEEDSYSSTLSDVSVQIARVSAAEASAANYQSRLNKMILRAPITGIISKQDAKIGESISAGAQLISIISGASKIEAFVPEVSVAGIVLGAKAQVTLDAYGEGVVFNATVNHIDPRETMRDGVSTYKIDLLFDQADSRVLSGMTTNISIETLRKQDVIMVPQRAINTKNGKKSVSVKIDEKNTVEQEIKTGLSDSSGNIEVLSGVRENDVVLLEPKS